jgi:hypothetical protein
MTDFAQAEVHLNDVGTRFQLTLEDGDGTAVNISTATTKEFVFRKPDGSTITRDATFSTDGSNGVLYYDTVTGDIDQAGQWKVQAYVDMTGFDGHSGEKTFVVHKNLRAMWDTLSSSST